MEPETAPPHPSPLCLLCSGVNSPSWLCFSQHVVARLDSSRYFSASWSFPLLRRGRRARLSSAKLRLEVSSISLSTWRSWNLTEVQNQTKAHVSCFKSMTNIIHKFTWRPVWHACGTHSESEFTQPETSQSWKGVAAEMKVFCVLGSQKGDARYNHCMQASRPAYLLLLANGNSTEHWITWRLRSFFLIVAGTLELRRETVFFHYKGLQGKCCSSQLLEVSQFAENCENQSSASLHLTSNISLLVLAP